MTVSTTENRIQYDGDGVSTVFDFPYKFLATTDLMVYVDGVLQTLTTHYSVGTPSDSGANVTFVTAPAIGDANVVILRDVDTLQESELPSNGPFPSSTVELMVDKITLQVQRLRDLVSRAITLSDADSSTASTTLPSPEAGTLLGWNDALTGLQNVDPADLLTVAGSSGFSYQTFSGTGAQLNFTLNENPGAIANLSVFVSGVRQTPITDYTVAGTTLTFIVAPALGAANILAVWGTTLGIGVPSDTSVTLVKMPDGVFSATSAALAKFADGFLAATAEARAKMADGFITMAKLSANIFNSATSATIVSADKLIFSDASDSGNTKAGLVSDVVALTIADVARHVPVRQTVLSGPVDSSGLPNFGGATGSTTVTMSGTLVATAANGTLNRSGSGTNPSWTGLSTNGTMYLYVDVNADGTLTTGSSTLAPTYRWGGADVTTNGQFTFNIQEMQGKVGNGSTAVQTYRVYIGEVTVAVGAVTAITWYALMGRYISPDQAIPGANTQLSVNHNIGVTPNLLLYLKNNTTELNYAVGDMVQISGAYNNGSVATTSNASRMSASVISLSATPFALANKTTGGSTIITSANWRYVFRCDRGW